MAPPDPGKQSADDETKTAAAASAAAVRFFIFVGVCIERQVDESIGRIGSLFNRPPLLMESRIIASNSGRPEPYTGTRTVLVSSSRPRGRRPRPAAERDLGGPALQRMGPQGTSGVPGNNGPAGRGVIQERGLGPRADPELECAEIPAFDLKAPRGGGRVQTQNRWVSHVRGELG